MFFVSKYSAGEKRRERIAFRCEFKKELIKRKDVKRPKQKVLLGPFIIWSSLTTD